MKSRNFFTILGHIAAKAGAVVIAKNPAYTSQLLSYRDEIIFTNCGIREYWDETEKLLIDRDINAGLNIKRVGLDVFPTLKRRKGGIEIVASITDSTSKEVLQILSRVSEKPIPAAPRGGVGASLLNVDGKVIVILGWAH